MTDTTDTTDRELLERAARAAGYTDAKYQDGEGWMEVRYGFSEAIWSEIRYQEIGEGYWNPLALNSDAFELLVLLDFSSLMIFSDQGKRREFWSPNSGYDGGKSATNEREYGEDPYAATRKAITLAAASMDPAPQRKD